MKKEKKKLIVILGPTSSGKTSLAVKLAYKFNGEIVSADSRQVYKGMNIGTGKDLKEYKVKNKKIPYHLIDVIKPNTQFSLAKYQKLAYKAIDDILKRGKVPFLAGGTGLYIQAVVDGYVLPPAKPDLELRKRLAKLSLKQLLARLKKLDLQTYKTIDKNNRRRVERAVEICLLTGMPLSKQRKKVKPPYDILILGIGLPKEVLYKKIDKRLKERLKQGMVAEVKRLHQQGVSWKRLEGFGLEYRWIARYLQKKLKYDEMVEGLCKDIKKFTKRQITWFKRDKGIKWLKNYLQAYKLINKFLNK